MSDLYVALAGVLAGLLGLGIGFGTGIRSCRRAAPAARDQQALERRVEERTQALQAANNELVAAVQNRGELAQELQRLVDIVEGADDYISFANLQGGILYLNRGGRKMIGISPDEDVTKLRIPDLHPFWANDIILGEAIGHALTIGSWRGETAVLARDGTEIPASQVVMAHRNPEGEVTHLSTIIRDISDHKHMELGLLRAMEKARAASQAKSEFLAAMSHEIRTPMNAIIGAAQVLAEAPLDAGYRHYVDLLHSASDTLLQLIDDILDLSKIEARKMDLDVAPLSPVEVCEQALDVIAARASAKGLELVWDCGASVPAFVRGDAGRLRQILVNLLTNAVKYTEAGEITLRVSAHPPGSGRLRFAVADTGPGIDHSKLEVVFDAFTQASPAPLKQGRGVGLGLAISRNLAGLMGGRLWAESQVGAGSTFILELPVEAIEVPAGNVLEGKIAQPLAARVLVVDDNASNRGILRNLAERFGCRAEACEDGARALVELLKAAAAGDPYDVVLLDGNMPGLAGVEVAGRVRDALQGGPIPAMLLLSSATGTGELCKARAAGITHTLMKPVKRWELEAALREAAQVSQAERKLAEPAGPASGGAGGPPAEPGNGGKPLRILLAEDTPGNQDVFKAFLRFTPHLVDIADNGAEALRKLQEAHYDLVFMDMQMPVMDGFSATLELRRIEREQGLPATPVIALTAYSLRSDEERCLAAGCDAYMSKPIRKQHLLDTIAGHAATRV